MARWLAWCGVARCVAWRAGQRSAAAVWRTRGIAASCLPGFERIRHRSRACRLDAKPRSAMHGESASMLRSCCPACICSLIEIIRSLRCMGRARDTCLHHFKIVAQLGRAARVFAAFHARDGNSSSSWCAVRVQHALPLRPGCLIMPHLGHECRPLRTWEWFRVPERPVNACVQLH